MATASEEVNGTTPPETPHAKHVAAMAQLYEIPEGATPDQAVRVCAAAMRATNGRLTIFSADLEEFRIALSGLRARHASHWVWPLVTGAALALAAVQHWWPR